MSVKSKLKHSLRNVLQLSHSGSFATRSNRLSLLTAFFDRLVDNGYKIIDVHSLKQKHIESVISHWKNNGLSNATLKNRLSAVRYLAELMNRSQVVPSNKALGVGARNHYAQENRAQHAPDLSRLVHERSRISVELQRAFGLRREESLKIKPHMADKGDRLDLMPTWCKGGRGRVVPILTEEQRYWLERAKAIAGKFDQSLIPSEKNYKKHSDAHQKRTLKAGLKALHGLRHAYAQRRYKELTGWEAPKNGGPTAKMLTPEQRTVDYRARMVLTEELGHSRENITVSYLGR